MIKDAMKSYFEKQNNICLHKYNTLPTTPYDHERRTLIYKGTVNDENLIQWKPVHAKTIEVKGLCPELTDFYSSYYYGFIEGKIEDIYYTFPGIFNQNEAINQAKWALRNGEDLFPEENIAIIAICKKNETDGLLLAHEQDTNKLFIWDGETDNRQYLDMSLETLIRTLTIIV